ncbi:MAG: hypothetical protein K2X55_10620 [Burkholderiaceae bacterium]|nr:hypothetical protein [Burkholderiaceae bacterium]
MSRIPSSITPLPPAEQLRWLRHHLGENQTHFWSRFGVTQSQGSRYEQGGEIPAPVAILLYLYVRMYVSDTHLRHARFAIQSVGTCQLPAPLVVGDRIAL